MQHMHLTGYEIHSGQTRSPCSWLKLFRNSSDRQGTVDGARSADGRIWGCYMHGLFDNDGFRRAWLKSLGVSPATGGSMASSAVDAELDRIADAVEMHLDMEQLDSIIHNADLHPPSGGSEASLRVSGEGLAGKMMKHLQPQRPPRASALPEGG
jgi:adenosylcobyric acid synthase